MLKRFWDCGGQSNPMESDPAALRGSNLDAYVEREREYARKALELTGPTHPAYNIAPVLDLVRRADALGFDVVRRTGQ